MDPIDAKHTAEEDHGPLDRVMQWLDQFRNAALVSVGLHLLAGAALSQMPEKGEVVAPTSLTASTTHAQVNHVLKEGSEKAVVLEALKAERAALMDQNIDRYLDPVSSSYRGEIPPLEVYLQAEAYQRVIFALQHEAGGDMETLDFYQARVQAIAQQWQNLYQNKRAALLKKDVAWTGDPVEDFKLLRPLLYEGPDAFFSPAAGGQAFFGKELSSAHEQLESGFVNCKSALFVPLLLQAIYEDRGFNVEPLKQLSFIAWNDHLASTYDAGEVLQLQGLDAEINTGLASPYTAIQGVVAPGEVLAAVLLETKSLNLAQTDRVQNLPLFQLHGDYGNGETPLTSSLEPAVEGASFHHEALPDKTKVPFDFPVLLAPDPAQGVENLARNPLLAPEHAELRAWLVKKLTERLAPNSPRDYPFDDVVAALNQLYLYYPEEAKAVTAEWIKGAGGLPALLERYFPIDDLDGYDLYKFIHDPPKTLPSTLWIAFMQDPVAKARVNRYFTDLVNYNLDTTGWDQSAVSAFTIWMSMDAQSPFSSEDLKKVRRKVKEWQFWDKNPLGCDCIHPNPENPEELFVDWEQYYRVIGLPQEMGGGSDARSETALQGERNWLDFYVMLKTKYPQIVDKNLETLATNNVFVLLTTSAYEARYENEPYRSVIVHAVEALRAVNAITDYTLLYYGWDKIIEVDKTDIAQWLPSSLSVGSASLAPSSEFKDAMIHTYLNADLETRHVLLRAQTRLILVPAKTLLPEDLTWIHVSAETDVLRLQLFYDEDFNPAPVSTTVLVDLVRQSLPGDGSMVDPGYLVLDHDTVGESNRVKILEELRKRDAFED